MPSATKEGARGDEIVEITVTVPGIVIWSHLSKTTDAHGRLLYRSGVRLEADMELFASAMNRLTGSGRIQRDTASLEHKRKKQADREEELRSRPVVQMIHGATERSPDVVLLVLHARDRLRENANDAIKWYNRAKFSISEDSYSHVHHREEVLAVWEYLERSVDIQTILDIFEMKR